MRSTKRGIILFFIGAALIAYAALYPSGPRVTRSPRAMQMSAVSKIVTKIRQYDLDHAALETDELKTKSIDDLVAMDILTADDAAYLREHEVMFYGYDPNHVASDVPVFDTIHARGRARQRITAYSDGHVGFSPMELTKPVK